MQKKRLANRGALITGATCGIGKAIAIAFAKEGADVVINFAHNEERANKVRDEIRALGVECYVVKADVSQSQDREQLIEQAITNLKGKLDILVNNAGVLTRTSFLNVTMDEFQKVTKTNYESVFFLTQIAAQYMAKNNIKGSIINISSDSDQLITPGLIHYEGSKAAVTAFSRSAASDLAKHGIRVNSIAPGLVATEINRDQWEPKSAIWKNRVSHIPLGRAGEPEEIAAAAVYLASDVSGWMTGNRMLLDGGSFLNHNGPLKAKL